MAPDGRASAAAPDGGATGSTTDGEAARPAGPGTPATRTGLSGRERAVLAFERRSWAGPGAKERAVREELGMAPIRYYQLLNALLDDPHAERHDPVTVHRLRRVREERRARRAPRAGDGAV